MFQLSVFDGEERWNFSLPDSDVLRALLIRQWWINASSDEAQLAFTLDFLGGLTAAVRNAATVEYSEVDRFLTEAARCVSESTGKDVPADALLRPDDLEKLLTARPTRKPRS
jgi:hypothetical protein